uniref:Amino_oxidase domain-containing protein n=1 Tax=Caenorhabditis tropicalis TaxID=1561998 RepID=A0A1I7TPA6_9PELO
MFLLEFFLKYSTLQNISVAIVGAGFAGLRAAQRFEELDISYTLFEGSDRLGGRVYPFSYQNGYLQYGAEYVNGVNNEIYEIVKKNNLLSKTEIDEDGYETVVYGKEVNNKLYNIWDKFESSTNEKLERDGANKQISSQNVSQRIDFYFDAFLKTQKLSQSEQTIMENMNKLFKNQFQLEWSSPADDLCLRNFDTWDSGVDSEATLNEYGFKTILDDLISKVPKTKIKMSSKVVNIDYSGNKVKILLSNGQSFLFDSVIVTSSLGYLKKNKNSMFTPSLPAQKSAAIDRFGFGNNMKVFLENDRPWWPRGMSTVQISGRIGSSGTGTSLEDDLMVFQPSLWAKNILVAWIAGNGPKEVSKLSDSQLITILNNHLTSNLKDVYTVSKIKKIYRHNWISDDFALGSYSYISIKTCQSNTEDIKLMRNPILINRRPIVCFAGEHTDSEMYQTVVGAARSGLQEADRINNYYSSL